MIYFSGSSKSKITTITYNLPEICTIFLVLEVFDEEGPVLSYIKNDQVLFAINNVRYLYLGSYFAKFLKFRKKYSFVKINKKKLIDLIITNDEFRMNTAFNKQDFIFDKFMLGNGKGILYELIVFNGIMKEDEIRKNVMFLNSVHKIN